MDTETAIINGNISHPAFLNISNMIGSRIENAKIPITTYTIFKFKKAAPVLLVILRNLLR
jgi:hypothetical protein